MDCVYELKNIHLHIYYYICVNRYIIIDIMHRQSLKAYVLWARGKQITNVKRDVVIIRIKIQYCARATLAACPTDNLVFERRCQH